MEEVFCFSFKYGVINLNFVNKVNISNLKSTIIIWQMGGLTKLLTVKINCWNHLYPTRLTHSHQETGKNRCNPLVLHQKKKNPLQSHWRQMSHILWLTLCWHLIDIPNISTLSHWDLTVLSFTCWMHKNKKALKEAVEKWAKQINSNNLYDMIIR